MLCFTAAPLLVEGEMVWTTCICENGICVCAISYMFSHIGITSYLCARTKCHVCTCNAVWMACADLVSVVVSVCISLFASASCDFTLASSTSKLWHCSLKRCMHVLLSEYYYIIVRNACKCTLLLVVEVVARSMACWASLSSVAQ